MNANKDEALRCIEIAKRRLIASRTEDARKFVKKALRLDPTVNLDGLESLLTGSRPGSPHRRCSADINTSPNASDSAGSGPASEVAFSKSQAEDVRKLLACKDYYELLGVSKDSSEDDIKRAYKLRALKCHPDKNRAPGSTEAFKKIGTALDVLTDPEKRRRYDKYGTADDSPRITHAYGHEKTFFRYDGHQAFDADVFSMFFNGGFPFSQVYRGHRHRPPPSQESERENNYFAYIQLLPLLILFGLSFFSSLFVRDPVYNLARSTKYSVERHTDHHQVTYYVKPSFEKEYDGGLVQLERQVEEEFVGNLRYRCYREKEYKENLIFRSRYYGDEAGLERATRMQMPSCDTLVNMFGG